jgi:hypothetical protein
MLSMVLSFLVWLTPLAQQSVELRYDIRAAQKLLMAKGTTSGRDYYDVVITRQPTDGVLIKLDYSRRPTKFSFDLHHRLSLDPNFAFPADVITNIEVLSGGTTSMGTFTIASTIKAGDVFEEAIEKISKADVDRYVTPFGTKRISLTTIPGSQSISIVGQSVVIQRGPRNTRIETPGQRIAIVSNFKFEENRAGTPLE